MAKKRGDYRPRATKAQIAQRDRRKREARWCGMAFERKRIATHLRAELAKYAEVDPCALALRVLAKRAGLDVS